MSTKTELIQTLIFKPYEQLNNAAKDKADQQSKKTLMSLKCINNHNKKIYFI